MMHSSSKIMVKHSSGFFKASCINCDRYSGIFAFEERLDGVTRRVHRYCEVCAPLAELETPIIRQCEFCGAFRNVRIYDSCQCGCCNLKSIRCVQLTEEVQINPPVRLETWRDR